MNFVGWKGEYWGGECCKDEEAVKLKAKLSED